MRSGGVLGYLYVHEQRVALLARARGAAHERRRVERAVARPGPRAAVLLPRHVVAAVAALAAVQHLHVVEVHVLHEHAVGPGAAEHDQARAAPGRVRARGAVAAARLREVLAPHAQHAPCARADVEAVPARTESDSRDRS